MTQPRIPLDHELAIAQVSDYAIFMIDTVGRAASWNEGVRRVLGWSESEWLGQPAHVLFPPGEKHQAQQELATARQKGRANDDRWLIRKDGTRFFANGVTTSISQDGVQVGYLKVLRDQTHQHDIEEALRVADRRKDDFLATLAHELRNPLAPIRNGLHIMRRAGDNPEALERARGMMERQLGYVVHLIDDLMDISRITHGKLELRLQTLRLAAVIDSAVEMARTAIEAEAHELVVEPVEPQVRVEGDLTRLAQVFANLLINAAKYTERGGRITLHTKRTARHAEVLVTDTGIGLSQDALEHVFEMFSQLNRKPDVPQGLGIGLGLARALVDMHGGTISASSAGPGEGTTFTVRLPLAATEVASTGTAEEAVPIAVDRRRVLVVDDNADSAESLATLLRMSGHEACTAYDGAHALEVAEQFRPDVVLLDIGMPRMDGFEAARRIRRRPWGQGVLLLAMTGWGQEADRQRSREAGIAHHLVKPVDPQMVERLLADLSSVAALD